MKYSVVPIVILLLASLSFAGEPEWKKITDKNDIRVYRAHSDETKMKTFKGVTRFPIHDLKTIIAIIMDDEELSDWMHMISKVRFLKSDSPDHVQYYVETRLPWPVKDRDAYIDVYIRQKDDYSLYFDVLQAEDAPEPKKGYVRIPEVKGYLSADTVPNTEEIDFTYEMVLDPGGYVPAWMVNLITADVPYFTLKRLRRVVGQEKYQDYETDLIEHRPWLDTIPVK